MKITSRHINLGIGIVFIIMLILFFFLYKSSAQCLADPLTFAAENAYEKGADLSCACSIPGGEYAPFRFDHNGITQQTPIGSLFP